jgi:hypothetical protein
MGCAMGTITCHMAAISCSLECLQYAISQNGADIGDIYLVRLILQRTNLEKRDPLGCVKYILEMGYDLPNNVCDIAALNDQADCLRYLHEYGAICNYTTMKCAIVRGSISCMQYLHDIACCSTNDASFCMMAVKHGNLLCLKFLHEHGYALDRKLYAFAVKRKKCFACLEYVLNNGYSIDQQ